MRQERCIWRHAAASERRSDDAAITSFVVDALCNC